MTNLELNISIPSLSFLQAISANTYLMVIRLYNSDGSLLEDTYIPNNYTATVVTTSPNFIVKVPVQNASFNYQGVRIKAFANAVTDCCFAQGTFNLFNDPAGPPAGVQARVVSTGWYEHLDLNKTRENAGWRLVDPATYALDSSGLYEWSYMINGKWKRTGSSHLNMFWPADTPISIFKFQSKIGLDSLNRWIDQPTDNPYYDLNACKPFSNNCSFAFVLLTFND